MRLLSLQNANDFSSEIILQIPSVLTEKHKLMLCDLKAETFIGELV